LHNNAATVADRAIAQCFDMRECRASGGSSAPAIIIAGMGALGPHTNAMSLKTLSP